MVDVNVIQSVNLYNYISKFYPSIKFTYNSKAIHKARCPFHKEKTPSFVVFENNNRFKCFGCNLYGNIINFVEYIEKVNFKEACKMIGDNEGIEVKFEKPNPEHEKYKNYMTENANRYNALLLDNNKAFNYLTKDRNISKDILNLFKVGYVPKDEFKRRKDIGGISGRVSFPIFENKNIDTAKVLGMGYRRLDNIKNIKYINDVNQDGRENQNPNLKNVFIKGNCIYGYPFAYRPILAKKFAIVVEGYIDVLSMHQAGFLNTVGCLSTSFTTKQIENLKKITNNILFFLDGDKAGINAMIKVLPTLYENNFNIKIFIAPSGKDPADICKENEFDKRKISSIIFKQCRPAINVIMDKVVKEYEDIVVCQRIKTINTIKPILDKIKNETEKTVYKSLLYKKIDI